jgi:cytochrome c biogenesis protein CcmG, thiol:disulfide interchange protein DsbE
VNERSDAERSAHPPGAFRSAPQGAPGPRGAAGQRRRQRVDRQWAMVGVLLALLVLLIGIGWTVRDRFLPVEVGSVAPDFAAHDLDGNPVRLADLRGEVVLLNIWATWCPPCREEMPSMQRLHEEFGSRGLQIVAVSIDAARGRFDRAGRLGGDVEGFAREMRLTFPLWLDPAGDIQRVYRATGVPESFVIDRDGMIVKKVIGATEWDSDANRELFERLLEG